MSTENNSGDSTNLVTPKKEQTVKRTRMSKQDLEQVTVLERAEIRSEIAIRSDDVVAVAVSRFERDVEEEIRKVDVALRETASAQEQMQQSIQNQQKTEIQTRVNELCAPILAALSAFDSAYAKYTLNVSWRMAEDATRATHVQAVYGDESRRNYGGGNLHMWTHVFADIELSEVYRQQVETMKTLTARLNELRQLKSELAQKLASIGKIERQARAAIAERSLVDTASGQVLLGVLNDLPAFNAIPRLTAN